jgi:hypothetical protein
MFSDQNLQLTVLTVVAMTVLAGIITYALSLFKASQDKSIISLLDVVLQDLTDSKELLNEIKADTAAMEGEVAALDPNALADPRLAARLRPIIDKVDLLASRFSSSLERMKKLVEGNPESNTELYKRVEATYMDLIASTTEVKDKLVNVERKIG